MCQRKVTNARVHGCGARCAPSNAFCQMLLRRNKLSHMILLGSKCEPEAKLRAVTYSQD